MFIRDIVTEVGNKPENENRDMSPVLIPQVVIFFTNSKYRPDCVVLIYFQGALCLVSSLLQSLNDKILIYFCNFDLTIFADLIKCPIC